MLVDVGLRVPASKAYIGTVTLRGTACCCCLLLSTATTHCCWKLRIIIGTQGPGRPVLEELLLTYPSIPALVEQKDPVQLIGNNVASKQPLSFFSNFLGFTAT
jgi:hypothetical protein